MRVDECNWNSNLITHGIIKKFMGLIYNKNINLERHTQKIECHFFFGNLFNSVFPSQIEISSENLRLWKKIGNMCIFIEKVAGN